MQLDVQNVSIPELRLCSLNLSDSKDSTEKIKLFKH